MSDERVAATWDIQLNCDCPKCGNYVDLLTAPDFWDGRSDFKIGEHDTKRADNLSVQCPECDHEFIVECVW